jgi:glycosyltransferase involved in cell wall biosynthesis
MMRASNGRQPTVCFPFIGHVVGGSHLSSLLLIEGLRDRGFGVVTAVHRSGALTDLLSQRGIEWVPVEVPEAVWRSSTTTHVRGLLSAQGPLRSFLRDHAVDLVHTNDGRMHRLWGLATKPSRRPWVLHHRTPGLSRGLALAARGANAILTVSEYARRSLPPALARRAVVVDNPFDPHGSATRGDTRAELSAAFGRDPDTLIVGFVSNMRQSRKRPETFVEIAGALTTDHGIDAIFPMFGVANAKLSDVVAERCASLGLTDRCQMMGSRMPVEPWMAACDLLVIPAIDEPFGRTLVEAAMLGVPVVAADDGGHPEIIRDGSTGFLFPPTDVRAAAVAAARLLTDRSLRIEMGAASRAAALRRFSSDRHVDQVLAIYRQLLGTTFRAGST